MFPDFLKRFAPTMEAANWTERLRAAVGALIGILVTGYVSRLALGDSFALPLLIAPMGASSVLLFAVPASPLAQPWSIIGGNLIAATVGVTALIWIPDLFIAAAVAAAAAIALMITFRCVHPPSGAVALTAVLGGPAVAAAGYEFVLWPVGVNTLLLVVAAIIYNNLTGRSYPHKPVAAPNIHATKDPHPTERIGLTDADIEAVLRAHNQLFDVNPEDIAGIVREAERNAHKRLSSEITCGDIMSRDVVTVLPGAGLRDAYALLREHDIKALPVIDGDGQVAGIVTQTDLLSLAMADEEDRSVADIMTRTVRTARPDTPIADIVPLMADGGLHHMPVIGENNLLIGIVTQSDLIAALVSRESPAPRPPAKAVPA